MDINFIVKPMFDFRQNECQIPPLIQDGDDHHHPLHQNKEEEQLEGEEEEVQKQEKEDNKEGGKKYRKFMVSSLKLKLPPPRQGEFTFEDDCQNDGFKTPTSSNDKIPVVLQCPPAPRKPRSLPSSATKRKAMTCRRVLMLDLSKEIESLFPPNIVGLKIKKVRQECK